MATFKPAVRTKEEFNAVYIRISVHSKTDYIKTSIVIHKSCLDAKGDIIDYETLGICYIQIKEYVERMKSLDTSNWTAKEIKKFLMSDKEGISFTDFAREYIKKIRWNESREKPANNYQTALNSLLSFYGRENIYFHEITAIEMRQWIKSLSGTRRAKQMYPVCIKKLFNDGCLEHNDYDRNIIRIHNQPFRAVYIPSADVPAKRSVDISSIRNILSVQPETEREQLAHDIVILVLHLAGINLIDLYKVEKQCLIGEKLCYNRSKTQKKRRDKSYFEIKIYPKISCLLEKYSGKKFLFSFADKYTTADIFTAAVNKGLKSLCSRAEEPSITSYSLRHTWATIARNECGASMEQVGFCLNHSSAHHVTEAYIDKDFSPVDVLNEKVIGKIFYE